MIQETLKERIERWKLLCETFVATNRRAFIKDYKDTWYSCDIIFVGESTLEIECFEPEDMKGERYSLFWAEIVSIVEYKKGGRNENQIG